ncbi:hypothetical protein N8I77_007051 [Diaporthe amygdali]|uniref:Uncharacterized protein n=1 Tax=Phomopsis amygdali TaxID=1214568 RepID=A0AAD9SCD5_PHOAM|nr:hypothetical protein N8I77_007051 [Diaporthe amygdali]
MDLIDEGSYKLKGNAEFMPGIAMKEYRGLWKAEHAVQMERLKKKKLTLLSAFVLWPPVNMQSIQDKTDDEIASRVEMCYVGARHYLIPGFFEPPNLIDRFGDDWRMNARGIYYRHHYSPGWVTADHSLWLPSLDGVDWNDEVEASRRIRAKSFLKHALDNEKWNKSEYAWEADAWTDVFSLMRNDPALSKTHPATCLLTGESKFIKRIPDATFGLATFQPSDYQDAVAEWDLDRDRLEALLLHRQCGLISDPRWGETNLVFPFSAYEAKGWSGDAREARRQGCLAGKVYLDLLDNLSRQPGKAGEENGQYQTDRSRNSQVFVFTSFGAHWHILVGYKRPRLEREQAGYEGVSDSVYVFQRIWSSRVTTERRAWELLSLVDQIHHWGVTDFRDFVMRHLRPWHDFVKKCYINDVSFVERIPETGEVIVDDELKFRVPAFCLLSPEWTKHFTNDACLRFEDRAWYHLHEAWTKYRGVKTEDFPEFHSCLIGECRLLGNSGYPLASTEEGINHLREVHGADDAGIAKVVHAFETRNFSQLSNSRYEKILSGDPLRPKNSRK